MSITKQDAMLGELVDVWRFHSWIAAQAAHPIVEVIDR